ncbi:MAG: hypothetical protein P1V97_37265, partial [Planctomycetota bacterium]|nr:hypothetical protein [Planctomycetota bacterium]
VDDAFRGANLKEIKKLGQLLQKCSKKYPGFCAPFLGDRLATQRSTLGQTAAARYLRMRLKSQDYGADHGWLRDRQMRHPGTELPEIFWAPATTSKMLTLRQLAGVTKERNKGRLLEYWIHLSRSIIVEPENRDALLLRAFAASNYGEYGRAANDLRRRAQLQPNDWKGWRDLADFLGSRFGLIEETLDALERALKSGADRKILDSVHFQYLTKNNRFNALKKNG